MNPVQSRDFEKTKVRLEAEKELGVYTGQAKAKVPVTLHSFPEAASDMPSPYQSSSAPWRFFHFSKVKNSDVFSDSDVVKSQCFFQVSVYLEEGEKLSIWNLRNRAFLLGESIADLDGFRDA